MYYIQKREYQFVRECNQHIVEYVTVARCKTLRGARLARERRDMQHGGYAFVVTDENGRSIL